MDESTRQRLDKLWIVYQEGNLDSDLFWGIVEELGGSDYIIEKSGGYNRVINAQRDVQFADNGGASVGGDVELVVVTNNGSINYITQLLTNIPSNPINLKREIANYLKWIMGRYGVIKLEGIVRNNKQIIELTLDQAYVPLQAASESQRQTISLNQVLPYGKRIVITGGPGSGKTTVLLHIAWALAKALACDDPQFALEKLGIGGSIPLPIFIPLNAYVSYLRSLPEGSSAESHTLAAFIPTYLIQRHSSFHLPPDFFDQLIRNGAGVVLLLDGLDEVPDEETRTEVTQAIEDLVIGREDRIRVVVTCRTTAYKGGTVLGYGFQEIRVLPLTTQHIIRIIDRAYAAIESNPEKQREYSSSLIHGIQQLESTRRKYLNVEVERFVSSPLIVRMLIIVHYSERELPQQRAELYRKTVKMLLMPTYATDRKVANKLAKGIGRDWRQHQEILQYIAYHMHSSGKHQGQEISERELRGLLLSHPTFATLAETFIAVTRQRGTLLSETNGIYRFVHLSFQEYLTARYLAETIGRQKSTTGLVQILENDGAIDDSWWREPILLTAGYLSDTATTDGAEEFITYLADLNDERTYRNAKTKWASVDLATTAVLEWPNFPQHILSRLIGKITKLFASPDSFTDVPALLRANVGSTLSHLGDPRTEILNVDDMEFCYVPEGPFWMGDPSKNTAHLQSCLENGYWISKYPITHAQYQQFVLEGGYSDRTLWSEAIKVNRWYDNNVIMHWSDGWRQEPKHHNLSNHPARGISWYEALAFTRWLTKRWHRKRWMPLPVKAQLPTEAQWEKAARGGIEILDKPIIMHIQDLRNPLPKRTSILNSHPRRKYTWGDHFDELAMGFDGNDVADIHSVGCFPNGNSPYGCEDMLGNVWEWTSSLHLPYPYKFDFSRERLTRSDDENCVLRGRNAMGKQTNCHSRRWFPPAYDSHYAGLRVVICKTNN